jgi:hypothetical protein
VQIVHNQDALAFLFGRTRGITGADQSGVRAAHGSAGVMERPSVGRWDGDTLVIDEQLQRLHQLDTAATRTAPG